MIRSKPPNTALTKAFVDEVLTKGETSIQPFWSWLRNNRPKSLNPWEIDRASHYYAPALNYLMQVHGMDIHSTDTHKRAKELAAEVQKNMAANGQYREGGNRDFATRCMGFVGIPRRDC